jgi:hypothetical protein
MIPYRHASVRSRLVVALLFGAFLAIGCGSSEPKPDATTENASSTSEAFGGSTGCVSPFDTKDCTPAQQTIVCHTPTPPSYCTAVTKKQTGPETWLFCCAQ